MSRERKGSVLPFQDLVHDPKSTKGGCPFSPNKKAAAMKKLPPRWKGEIQQLTRQDIADYDYVAYGEGGMLGDGDAGENGTVSDARSNATRSTAVSSVVSSMTPKQLRKGWNHNSLTNGTIGYVSMPAPPGFDSWEGDESRRRALLDLLDADERKEQAKKDRETELADEWRSKEEKLKQNNTLMKGSDYFTDHKGKVRRIRNKPIKTEMQSEVQPLVGVYDPEDYYDDEEEDSQYADSSRSQSTNYMSTTRSRMAGMGYQVQSTRAQDMEQVADRQERQERQERSARQSVRGSGTDSVGESARESVRGSARQTGRASVRQSSRSVMRTVPLDKHGVPMHNVHDGAAAAGSVAGGSVAGGSVAGGGTARSVRSQACSVVRSGRAARPAAQESPLAAAGGSGSAAGDGSVYGGGGSATGSARSNQRQGLSPQGGGAGGEATDQREAALQRAGLGVGGGAFVPKLESANLFLLDGPQPGEQAAGAASNRPPLEGQQQQQQEEVVTFIPAGVQMQPLVPAPGVRIREGDGAAARVKEGGVASGMRVQKGRERRVDLRRQHREAAEAEQVQYALQGGRGRAHGATGAMEEPRQMTHQQHQQEEEEAQYQSSLFDGGASLSPSPGAPASPTPLMPQSQTPSSSIPSPLALEGASGRFAGQGMGSLYVAPEALALLGLGGDGADAGVLHSPQKKGRERRQPRHGGGNGSASGSAKHCGQHGAAMGRTHPAGARKAKARSRNNLLATADHPQGARPGQERAGGNYTAGSVVESRFSRIAGAQEWEQAAAAVGLQRSATSGQAQSCGALPVARGGGGGGGGAGARHCDRHSATAAAQLPGLRRSESSSECVPVPRQLAVNQPPMRGYGNTVSGSGGGRDRGLSPVVGGAEESCYAAPSPEPMGVMGAGRAANARMAARSQLSRHEQGQGRHHHHRDDEEHHHHHHHGGGSCNHSDAHY
jgi:hypothetical protein